MDMRPGDDFKEVAIKNAEKIPSARTRSAGGSLGTVLIIGGYGAWSLIPVVIEADLEPSVKAALPACSEQRLFSPRLSPSP